MDSFTITNNKRHRTNFVLCPLNPFRATISWISSDILLKVDRDGSHLFGMEREKPHNIHTPTIHQHTAQLKTLQPQLGPAEWITKMTVITEKWIIAGVNLSAVSALSWAVWYMLHKAYCFNDGMTSLVFVGCRVCWPVASKWLIRSPQAQFSQPTG